MVTFHHTTKVAQIRNVIGIAPRNERTRKLMKSIAGDRPIKYLENIGIAPIKISPSKSLIKIAAESAKKQYKARSFKWVKNIFLKMQFNWSYQHFKKMSPSFVMVWNGQKGFRRVVCAAATAAGHRTIYLERAPLPGRISIDFMGVNAASSLPRSPDFFKLWQSRNANFAFEKWREVTSKISPRPAEKRRDVNHKPSEINLKSTPYIFLPLQVPGDSQITVFGDWIKSMEDLIDQVAIATKFLPSDWKIRIKEHPSSTYSLSNYIKEKSEPRIVIDNQTDTFEQVSSAKIVLTLNSSVGFEAIFFDKPVAILGKAFYDVQGVVSRIKSLSDLIDVFTAPEIVTFDADIRNAFMNYVTETYFPLEDDVLCGRYTIDHVLQRDLLRDDLLNMVKCGMTEKLN